MERKTAREFPQELLNLFDRYVHGDIERRDFLEGAQKFTTKVDDDSFRAKAEARLFGSADTKVVLWADF